MVHSAWCGSTCSVQRATITDDDGRSKTTKDDGWLGRVTGVPGNRPRLLCPSGKRGCLHSSLLSTISTHTITTFTPTQAYLS